MAYSKGFNTRAREREAIPLFFEEVVGLGYSHAQSTEYAFSPNGYNHGRHIWSFQVKNCFREGSGNINMAFGIIDLKGWETIKVKGNL